MLVWESARLDGGLALAKSAGERAVREHAKLNRGAGRPVQELNLGEVKPPTDMRCQPITLLLAALSATNALHLKPSGAAPVMLPKLEVTPVMSPTSAAALRFRGGATAKSGKPKDKSAPSAKFTAQVIAWAVLPTLLRLAFAALTATKPVDSQETTTLLQSLGLAAAAAAPSSSAALPFPRPWQMALAFAWVANNLAVIVPGRYDGQSAMAEEKPTAATANLFTPSGWAFAIWGPIFLGEWLMMLYLTNVPSAAALGAAAAPGWCAATAAQVTWCATFRPSVCGPRALWLPALLLATTGSLLGVSHRAVRSAGYGPLGNALVRWPVALHFGWITAASLVNLNNWLARRGTSLWVKEAAALSSVAAAVAASGYVTATTRDPIFAIVIAWALAAVAADGSRSARGLVADAVLDRIKKAASLGCGLAVLLACSQI